MTLLGRRIGNTRLKDVKLGDALVADGGFDCIEPGTLLEVKQDDDGELYVPCKGPDGKGPEGSERHYLSGQEDEHGYLIGLERVT